MELRDELVLNRNNREVREVFRRQDRLKIREADKEEDWGPYTAEYRAKVLEMVLKAQREIQQQQGETLQLISHQELVAIQVLWYRDGIFNHKVSDIYNRIYETPIDMSKHEDKFREEEKLLREVFQPDHVELIQKSLKIMKTKSLMVKKRGLQNDIENLLDEYLLKKKMTYA